MKQFAAPFRSFEGLEADTVARLSVAIADIALLIDRAGVIRDVAVGPDDFTMLAPDKWIGRPFVETVTPESRDKVAALVSDAAKEVAGRRRQVNHPLARGADVPILYSAVRLNDRGRVAVMGRDLRATALLQQRLVDAQQSMEREHWRARQFEIRNQILMHGGTQAMFLVEAESGRIIDANRAAFELFNVAKERLIGKPITSEFDVLERTDVEKILSAVRGPKRTAEIATRDRAGNDVMLKAQYWREKNDSFVLLRVETTWRVAPAAVGNADTLNRYEWLVDAIQNAPDAFVATTNDGTILHANPAFLDLTQVAAESEVRDVNLARWLGRAEVDFNVLLSNLKQHGIIRLFSTVIRGDDGVMTDVEVSAARALTGHAAVMGFVIRDVGRRLSVESKETRMLPHTQRHLTDLVGRSSLKDIVRESADMIERLCIEAALELTRDNRASAAELLGLSRQGLYIKLRRFGLA